MEEERGTKDIIKYGYIYTLVQLSKHELSQRIKTPSFMGNQGWVLHSVFKLMVREKPPIKKNKYGT